jgi:glycosyltransferase involved in cell wall biosynthesis
MANLTRQKGFFVLVDVFRKLRSEGINARLIIAGPCRSREIAEALNELREEFVGCFEYLAYVSGQRKLAFFADIDVFLFPSLESETQGIVNLEALAAGVPVIAYGHCCTAEDIVPAAGLIIPLARPFVEAALPMLKLWANDRSKLRNASEAARSRFEELALAGRDAVEEIIHLLCIDVTARTKR